MTSATPLTEAEEIELERIKDRIEASICKFKRELDADLDKIRRSLQDMCSTMETKDVSSGNCKSQLELPKFSDDRDFHKSSNVDRAIADEDLMEQHGSERYEEMDIELKMKIGVKDCTRVSTEMEDVEFLEEVTTPLQTKREMEIFMPMGKSTEVKKGRELEQNQLKQTECISHARQNVQVNELPMGLPISTHYSLPLSWLLNWFPRPTVKLKFVAQRDDELYGGFDDRSTVFVGYGECSIFDARGHSGIQMVNEYTSDQRSDTQHDELLVVFKNLPFKQNPHFRDVRGYNAAISGLMSCGRYNDAWTVYEMMEASNIRPDHVISSIMITVMRKNGDSAEDAWKFFEKMNQKGIEWSLEAVGALIKLFCDEGLKKEALIIQSELEKMGKQFDIEVESAAMWQPRPIVHFELRIGVDARAVERLDHGTMNGIEYVQHIVAFSCYRTCSQAKEFKETERLPIARRNASMRELAVTLKVVTNLTRVSIRYPKPMVKMKLMAHHGEVIEEDLNSMIFPISKKFKEAGVLFSCQGINGKYVEMDERAATLERTGFDIVDGDINDVSPWKKHFEIVSFSERNGTDLASSERVGTDLARLSAATKKADILQGKSIPILEADSQETVAVAKSNGSSSVLKKTSQLSDIDWLVSIWFPQPTVKMKHERLGSEIPKPSVKLKVWEGKAREAWLHDSLWTRNLKGEGLLRSQIVEGRSPADASWEFADVKARIPWFHGSLWKRNLKRGVLLHA